MIKNNNKIYIKKYLNYTYLSKKVLLTKAKFRKKNIEYIIRKNYNKRYYKIIKIEKFDNQEDYNIKLVIFNGFIIYNYMILFIK